MPPPAASRHPRRAGVPAPHPHPHRRSAGALLLTGLVLGALGGWVAGLVRVRKP